MRCPAAETDCESVPRIVSNGGVYHVGPHAFWAVWNGLIVDGLLKKDVPNGLSGLGDGVWDINNCAVWPFCYGNGYGMHWQEQVALAMVLD